METTTITQKNETKLALIVQTGGVFSLHKGSEIVHGGHGQPTLEHLCVGVTIVSVANLINRVFIIFISQNIRAFSNSSLNYLI